MDRLMILRLRLKKMQYLCIAFIIAMDANFIRNFAVVDIRYRCPADIQQIRHLRYHNRFTIDGIRNHINAITNYMTKILDRVCLKR